MEREGIITLSIRGFPRALRYLLIFENCLCLCVLEDFCLFYGNSCISPQECDKAFLKIAFEKCVSVKNPDLSKYLRTVYLLEKGRYFPPFL